MTTSRARAILSGARNGRRAQVQPVLPVQTTPARHDGDIVFQNIRMNGSKAGCCHSKSGACHSICSRLKRRLSTDAAVSHPWDCQFTVFALLSLSSPSLPPKSPPRCVLSTPFSPRWASRSASLNPQPVWPSPMLPSRFPTTKSMLPPPIHDSTTTSMEL